MKTAILLSTYHPNAVYLAEQLASIEKQTLPCDLIRREDDETRLGAMRSFEKLLSETDGYDYYAFADQDDVWEPEKMEVLVAEMQKAEAQYGVETPIVVHSDLTVVNANLEVLSDSFWAYSGIRADWADQSLPYLTISNTVTGCAMLLNAATRKVSLPFGRQAFMHDQWIAQSALRCGGKVIPVHRSLVQYRQHGNNTLGAVEYHGMSLRNVAFKHKLFWRAYRSGKGICWNWLPAFVYWKIRHIVARL